MTAVADLGALGPKEGPPVDYDWAPTFPAILPWIGILLLLLLPANRSLRAWWILVPLLVIGALRWTVSAFFGSIPSEAVDMMGGAFVGLAFGLSALWLASPYLSKPSRWVVFFLMLLVLEAASVLAYLGALDFSEAGLEVLSVLGFLAVMALIAAMALSLTARVCRRRPSAVLFSIVVYFWLAVLWAIPALAVWMISGLSGGFGPELYQMVIAALVMALATFAVVWPFVLLAFLSTWYRDRLFRFFRLGDPAPPAPPPATPPHCNP
ncbi:MAG TPA: hypothetical protein PKM73_15530 [Verrucomicrobiota bacterium]|nr:hypothetical protein [Verrucomicrobiota bacterium]HNU50861.1 hypothetical protein [Verrucomicrobiota bacterium]